MRIRGARGEDAGELAELRTRLFPHYPVPDPSLTVLAETGHVLAGYLSGTFHGAYTGPGAPVAPPHGYVLAIAVTPEHRGQGVGHALVEEFVRGAQCAGVRWVFALIDESEGVQERVRFFRAVGFTQVNDPDETFPAMGRWV